MRKLLVFDVETGGLDPTQHPLLSIGMVLWHDGAIVDRISIIVNEGREMFERATPEALKINGMTWERIEREGVSVVQAYNEIKCFLLRRNLWQKRVTLAGHNVAFDIGFLKRLWSLVGGEAEYRTVFSHRSLCTQTLAVSLELAGRVSWKSTGLDALTKYFGIEVRANGGKHDSLEDAVATAKLFNELLKFIRDPHKPSPENSVE